MLMEAGMLLLFVLLFLFGERRDGNITDMQAIAIKQDLTIKVIILIDRNSSVELFIIHSLGKNPNRGGMPIIENKFNLLEEKFILICLIEVWFDSDIVLIKRRVVIEQNTRNENEIEDDNTIINVSHPILLIEDMLIIVLVLEDLLHRNADKTALINLPVKRILFIKMDGVMKVGIIF